MSKVIKNSEKIKISEDEEILITCENGITYSICLSYYHFCHLNIEVPKMKKMRKICDEIGPDLETVLKNCIFEDTVLIENLIIDIANIDFSDFIFPINCSEIYFRKCSGNLIIENKSTLSFEDCDSQFVYNILKNYRGEIEKTNIFYTNFDIGYNHLIKFGEKINLDYEEILCPIFEYMDGFYQVRTLEYYLSNLQTWKGNIKMINKCWYGDKFVDISEIVDDINNVLIKIPECDFEF